MCCAIKRNAHTRQTAKIFEQTEDGYHNMATKTNGPHALASPTYDMNTLVFISVTCYRSFRFRILLHCDMVSMLSFPGFNDCITVKWCIFLNLSV